MSGLEELVNHKRKHAKLQTKAIYSGVWKHKNEVLKTYYFLHSLSFKSEDLKLLMYGLQYLLPA